MNRHIRPKRRPLFLSALCTLLLSSLLAGCMDIEYTIHVTANGKSNDHPITDTLKQSAMEMLLSSSIDSDVYSSQLKPEIDGLLSQLEDLTPTKIPDIDLEPTGPVLQITQENDLSTILSFDPSGYLEVIQRNEKYNITETQWYSLPPDQVEAITKYIESVMTGKTAVTVPDLLEGAVSKIEHGPRRVSDPDAIAKIVDTFAQIEFHPLPNTEYVYPERTTQICDFYFQNGDRIVVEHQIFNGVYSFGYTPASTDETHWSHFYSPEKADTFTDLITRFDENSYLPK